ncbi:MAG TPA: hypothetical protein VHU85_03595 [Acidimicrobiales bacterium]|jgi:hypothetical protein|nr:hypothetical protein [Acidimicrobiales bacterium]
MIRLTWRQFRVQAAVVFGGLAVVAVLLAVTGPHLVHLYDSTVATCQAHGDCSTVTNAFLANDSTLRTWLNILLIVIPGLIGIFWGAPLVAREIETGTYRLAWTQSVTRTRWLAVKLGAIGLATMAVAGLLSLMVTWWSSPLDRAHVDPFGTFDQRDIVVIGYAAFAFALGVTAGLLIRRTVPAMATTLVGFAAVRVAFTFWVRPHLMTPVTHTLALDPANMGYGSSNGGPATLQPNPPDIPNAWVYSTQIVDKAGHALTPSFLASTCPQLSVPGPAGGGPSLRGASHLPVPSGAQQVLQDCVTKVGATFHEAVVYQPGSRYWAFQGYELAIYLGAALILGGVCFWWLRRRIT